MSKVKPLTIAAVLLNLALLPASLVLAPQNASAFFHSGPPEEYDCCKEENGTGEGFCCDQCCEEGENCDTTEECTEIIQN